MSEFSPAGGNEGYGGYEDDMAYRDCIHTPGVICDRTTCKTCGWEPREARRRMKRIDRRELLRDKDGLEYLPVKKTRPSGGQEVSG